MDGNALLDDRALWVAGLSGALMQMLNDRSLWVAGLSGALTQMLDDRALWIVELGVREEPFT